MLTIISISIGVTPTCQQEKRPLLGKGEKKLSPFITAK
jgi:hypothetical protein